MPAFLEDEFASEVYWSLIMERLVFTARAPLMRFETFSVLIRLHGRAQSVLDD